MSRKADIDGKSAFRLDEPFGGWPLSVVGIDAGLATFACAHVRRTEIGAVLGTGKPFILVSGRVLPETRYEEPTVAEENAARSLGLLHWLRPVLAQTVCDGAESFHAERYEHLRQSSAAAKYAAGHAVLVAASALCDPRPKRQAAGSGAPAFVSGRDAKRAVTGCDQATKRVVIAAVQRLVAGAEEALGALLARERPHLADAIAVALCALGHRTKPLVREPEVTTAGPVALREEIAKLAGIGREYAACFAPATAATPLASLDGRALIHVGQPRHFDRVRGSELEWFEMRMGAAAYMVAVLPDPAAMAGWWNNPKNKARARTFLRAAVRV